MRIILSENQHRQIFNQSKRLSEQAKKLLEQADDIPISSEIVKEVLAGYIHAAIWTEQEKLENDFNSIMGYDDDDSYDFEESEEDNELQKMIAMSANFNNKSFDSFLRQDMDSDSKIQAYLDIKKFVSLAGLAAVYEVLDSNGANDMGMDIWLTRNGHGVGFTDRGYKYGKQLYNAAEQLKEVNLVIGVDMLLHFE